MLCSRYTAVLHLHLSLWTDAYVAITVVVQLDCRENEVSPRPTSDDSTTLFM